MKNIKKNLIFISNLEHSFPRIPGLAINLLKKGWNVYLVTPYITKKRLLNLGLPNEFYEKVNIIFTRPYNDIYEPIRKVLIKLKISKANQKNGFRNDLIEHSPSSYKISSKFTTFLLHLYQTIFAFPDTEKNWKKNGIETIEKLLDKKLDFILISSSPYPISHCIAQYFNKKYNLKWVADFRDPWSQNHNYKMFFFRKLIDKLYEKKILKDASLITTPSRGFKKKLTKLHNSHIAVIPNGYLNINSSEKIKRQNKIFNVVFTGRIYEGKQDIMPFLNGLKLLSVQNPTIFDKVLVSFYGPFSSLLQSKIIEFNLEKTVLQKGIQKRSKIYQIQKEAHILMLFNWNANESGIIPLKLYEYLITNRPILVTGKDFDGEISKIIKRTKTGFIAENELSFYKAMIDFFNKFKNGKINHLADNKIIREYSYASASNKLDKLLNSL